MNDSEIECFGLVHQTPHAHTQKKLCMIHHDEAPYVPKFLYCCVLLTAHQHCCRNGSSMGHGVSGDLFMVPCTCPDNSVSGSGQLGFAHGVYHCVPLKLVNILTLAKLQSQRYVVVWQHTTTTSEPGRGRSTETLCVPTPAISPSFI